MSTASFLSLTPDRVLDAVEVGGLRCTGRCLPMRAFENRVYEIELDDERRIVVKFYRPGRWSRETILDEHRFLLDLAAAELPAVAPLDLGTGDTLHEVEGGCDWLDVQLAGQSLTAEFILGQGGAALAALSQQQHQLPVCFLAPRFLL